MSDRTVLRRGLTLTTSYVRLHPVTFAISVAGAALFAACTVLSAVVLGRVTDQIVLPVFETGQTRGWSVSTGVAAVLSIGTLRIVGVVARRYFASATANRMQVTLRKRLVEQYLDLPLSWHQRTPAGQLLAHADNDSETATFVLNPLPMSLGVIFLVLFSAISMLMVDVTLALIAFLVFPSLAWFNRVYSHKVEGPAAEIQAAVGEVSTVAHESFDGALVVKTLGRAEAESERFRAVTQSLRHRRVKVGYMRATFEAVLDAMPNVGIIIVLIVGAYRVDAGAVRPGELLQVASLFSVLAFPMRVFGFFLESMPPSVVADERLRGVLEEPVPQPSSRQRSVPHGPVTVDIEDISYAYDESRSILEDVSFRIGGGEVVAVVGSTGGGKSTLVQLVAGLIPPQGGSIRISGVPVEEITPKSRTETIGLVFQESFLFADSVRANIDLLGTHSLEEVERAAKTASAADFIEEMPQGINTVVGERGVTLSGGQRQRVALARALLQKPRLLILDDATSAVDAKVEQEILAALRSELDMTTMVVAQRVSTIKLADRVVYLRGGRIAAAGTHEELLDNPNYRDLVTAYEEGAL